MQATETRFTAFDEPELLGPIATTRAATPAARSVADTDAVIDRIDRELHSPSPWVLGPESLLAWTHTAFDLGQRITWEPIGTVTTIYVSNWESVGGPFKVLWSGDPIQVELLAVDREQTDHLDSSLADIQAWLGIGLGPAAHAAGISRGTVYAWRQRGSSPRPATIGAIMRVHGLVASAVKAVGVEAAREWFHAGAPSPLSEMVNAQGDATRLRILSTRLRRDLFRVPVPPPNPLLAATSDDIVR